MNMWQRIFGIFLVTLAVLGLILCLGGVFVAWRYNTPLTDAAVSLLGAARTTVELVDELSQPLIDTLEVLLQPVARVESAANQLSENVADQGLVLTLLPEELSREITTSVETLRATIESILSALKSANDTLVALNQIPLVSVPTLEDTQLPAQLAQLQSNLERLVQQVQQARASAAKNIAELAATITEVRQEIEEGQEFLLDLQQRARQISTRLEELNAKIPLWVDIASSVLTFIFLLFLVGFGALFVFGWSLIKNPRLELQPGLILGEGDLPANDQADLQADQDDQGEMSST